jgi:cell division protein FtsL
VGTGTAASQRVLRTPRRQPAGASGRSLRWRQFTAIVLLAVGLVGVALLHVWLRLQVVHMGYVLATTSKLQNQLQQENLELKLELATLTSPDRLEALSRSRLGLRSPEKGQVIILP